MNDRIDYAIAPWDRTDTVSRELVRLITHSTNDGIWDWNLETNEIYYSLVGLSWSAIGPTNCPDMITFVSFCIWMIARMPSRQLRSIWPARVPNTATNFASSIRMGLGAGYFRTAPRFATSNRRRGSTAGTHTDITDRVRTAERLEAMVEERTVDLEAARDRAASTATATTKSLCDCES